jgi:hypothetical protein
MTSGARRSQIPWTLAAILAAGVGAAACSDPGSDVRSPASLGLPAWDDHARAVFDDNIDPAAVGYTLDASSARADKFLRERAQTAELVARMRVQTVTIDTIGDDSTYHLGVQVGSPTLAPGPKIEERSLELVIRSVSPAFGIAKALDQRMQGVTFIGFAHRFASADGTEVELHWHMSPDSGDVAEAVKEAVALAEAIGP